MAISRTNPLGIEAVGTIEADVTDDIRMLGERIRAAERGRQEWINDQLKLLRQREGIRKVKNVPWPGANNDSWPVTDSTIRRWKPALTALVLESDPVTFFFGRNEQSVQVAKSAQHFYDWLFNTHMDGIEHTAFELADLIAQHGIAYTRQGWDYKTERVSRTVDIDSVFKGGVEQFVAVTQQQLAEQGAQADAQQIVMNTLAGEYNLNPENENDRQQLQKATTGVLNGAPWVRVISQQVICDKPRWEALSPLDVLVPGSTRDSENAEWVAIAHKFSPDELRRMVRDGQFMADAANDLADKLGERKSGAVTDVRNELSSYTGEQLVRTLDQHEGIDGFAEDSDPRTTVLEIYCHLDINDDGIYEKVVLWYHLAEDLVLAIHEYPLPFKEWPIVCFEFERKDKRPYSSRGIAKMLFTHQKHVNRTHNGRLDAQQILLSPMWKVRNASYDLTRNVKFRPGGFIPVQNMSDVEPVIQDMRPLVEFFREEQITKSSAEQYVGVFDASLTDMGGTARERRTATEIQAVTSQISGVYEGDARLFQVSMAKVHRQIWDLWEDFGPKEVFARVTGEEEGRLVTKSEISGDFDLVPAGKPTSTNRAIMLARAREMMQMAAALPPNGQIVLNWAELVKNYFEVMDKSISKVVVRPDAEVAELQRINAMLQQISEQTGIEIPLIGGSGAQTTG
jgi:hypothetical protein